MMAGVRAVPEVWRGLSRQERSVLRLVPLCLFVGILTVGALLDGAWGAAVFLAVVGGLLLNRVGWAALHVRMQHATEGPTDPEAEDGADDSETDKGAES